MKRIYIAALMMCAAFAVTAQQFSLVVDTNGVGTLTFSNQFFTGVETLEGRTNKQWVSLQNFFTTQRVGQVTLPVPPGYSDYRARALSVAPGNAYTHLPAAYGNIHTLAGQGQVLADTNGWPTNTKAVDAKLLNPRAALADAAGNIYILEEDGHAVDQITPDGLIHTVLGTHEASFTPDFEQPGTNCPLDKPTGMFLAGGYLYVLDAGNARVRRLDQQGMERTVFIDPEGISNAGGLWVALDDLLNVTEIFYTAGTVLRYWTPDGGSINFATGFINLASVTRNPLGQIIVVDRGDNRVLRVRNNGSHVEADVQAGTGFPKGLSRGGNARRVSLPGPSSIWYLPVGGYFIGLDEGAKVWYVDESKNAAPIIMGAPGVHAGDGKWFRAPGKKISNVKSVALAPSGDILIAEDANGVGFVRQIDFLRHLP